MNEQRTLEEAALAADPDETGFCPDRLARINRWVDDWVEAEKLPFLAVLLSRRGKPAFYCATGMADIENAVPFREDHIVRIYSMTKPITSVALLMLFEQGHFSLSDPIEAFLPEFADMTVLAENAKSVEDVRPAKSQPTLHQLLTHRSGFTYGFVGDPLSHAYQDKDLGFGPNTGGLERNTRLLAELPLLFNPGEAWNYSVSTDVVGRIIEVISGQTLDAFFRKQIFEPLGMMDTQFAVPPAKAERLTSLYALDESYKLKLIDEPGYGSCFYDDRVTTLSGGGGLTGTMGDYARFVTMMRNKGKAGKERLLGPRTVDYMTRNHIGTDIASLGPSTFSETPTTGVGFGLGVWSMIDPAKATMMGSPGDFGWGGIASTVFWHDPLEDLSVILFTQLTPSSTYPIRKQLRSLIYQALCD